MTKYDSNQYVEIFYKLPPEIKDVVAASSTTEHLWKIGQKHNLQIDKVGIMTDIAFDVMMGIISTKNFIAELQKELQISALDASVLARDIDENVFKPIKSTMIALYGDKAPNKPSSSLVQLTEEDEDHHDLDKDLLLKEIESPTIAKPRVENKIEEKVTTETKPSVNTTVEEYHEEIKTGTVLPEIKEVKVPEPKAPTPPPASFDSLHRLADMKLSQAFVMPRMGGETTPAVTQAPITEPLRPKTDTSPLTKVEEKPATKLPDAAMPAPKSYTSDPYREPLA